MLYFFCERGGGAQSGCGFGLWNDGLGVKRLKRSSQPERRSFGWGVGGEFLSHGRKQFITAQLVRHCEPIRAVMFHILTLEDENRCGRHGHTLTLSTPSKFEWREGGCHYTILYRRVVPLYFTSLLFQSMDFGVTTAENDTMMFFFIVSGWGETSFSV